MIFLVGGYKTPSLALMSPHPTWKIRQKKTPREKERNMEERKDRRERERRGEKGRGSARQGGNTQGIKWEGKRKNSALDGFVPGDCSTMGCCH